MPDRVPLVHRHRRPHHFHYDDSTADMEEGALAAAGERRGGRDLTPLNAATTATAGPGGGSQLKQPKEPHSGTLAMAPATPSRLTPRAKAVLAASKSPKAGAGTVASGPRPAPPPHLSKSWPWILFGSLVLTFNAGYINTLTLNTLSAMPSAHVTGG